jgi:hypothetical protein
MLFAEIIPEATEQEYRAVAQVLREHARSLSSPDAAREFHGLAAQYEQLAESAAAHMAGGPILLS